MKTSAFFFLLLMPLQILAEDHPMLSTDSRVKITAPTLFSNTLTGNIARIQSDTLLLAPRTGIPLNAIAKLELSLGVQPLGKRVTSKAWKGALLLGGLVSAAAIDNWDNWDDRSGNKALLAIVGGTITGGVLGGTFGALHRPERWTIVPPTQLKHYAQPPYRTGH